MTRRGWGAGAAAVAACLVLAGCGGDPAPVVTPTPSPSESDSEAASPTPSPTATALTEEEILAALPPEAQVESFPGAVAFTEFFVALFPALVGDESAAQAFAVMSGPDCLFCSNALTNAELAREAGHSQVGGEFVFETTNARGGLRETGLWLVELPFEVGDTTVLDETGIEVETVDGGRGAAVAVLAWDDGEWTVDDIGFEFADA